MGRRLILETGYVDELAQAALAGDQPRVDVLELDQALDADILSWSDVDESRAPMVKTLAKCFGRDVALAWLGWRHAGEGTVFSRSEGVGLPLAALRLFRRRGRRHVMQAHHLAGGLQRVITRVLGLAHGIDAVITTCGSQADLAGELGVARDRQHVVPGHCDEEFFVPASAGTLRRDVLAVGTRHRDYPTLIAAMEELDAEATIVATPAATDAPVLHDANLPDNAVLCSDVSYDELRDLYGQAAVVVVPLRENDASSGLTSIHEALACATPVVVTDTSGLADALNNVDGVLRVPAGQPNALIEALCELLDDNRLSQSMGRRGRRSIERERGLSAWLNRISEIVARTEAQAPVAGRLAALAQAWTSLTARLWLRSAHKLGARVRTRGRPLVTNHGELLVGDDVTIDSRAARCELINHGGSRMEIGRGVHLEHGTVLSARSNLRIGDDCTLGRGVTISDHDVHVEDPSDKDGDPRTAPVTLGQRVVLGPRVTVLKGVTLGDDVVVGAGSVVTRSVPSGCVAVGSPAHVIRRRGENPFADDDPFAPGFREQELTGAEPEFA